MKDQTQHMPGSHAGWLAKTGGYAKDMTLRDYFAANASEEDIKFWMPKGFTETVIQRDSNGNCYEVRQTASWTREKARYRYADAMLKAGE